MKKYILFLLCLTPLAVFAQNYSDDLYFVPSDKEEVNVEKTEPIKTQPKTIYVKEELHQQGQNKTERGLRDVDEYNRRYDSSNHDFEVDDDTLYITEKEEPELEGEWLNGGFDGSDSDYEYAERIIRFRNPRFAISVSSPLYFDVVYGINSWDWNVYDDGFYAYAFPTFTNPLWWDWRFNSYAYNWGWGWNRPYYGSWYSGYYAGLHDAYWGCGWYDPYYPYYGHCGYYDRPVYYNNRRNYLSSNRSNGETVTHSTSRRNSYTNSQQPTKVQNNGTTRRSYTTSNGSTGTSRRNYSSRGNGSVSRRVVGTRSGSTNTSRRNATYTRPSSTRSTVSRSSNSNSTYRRSSRGYSTGSHSYRSNSSNSMPRRSSSYQTQRSSSAHSSSSYSSGTSSRRSYSSSGFSSGGSSHRSSIGSSSMGSSHSSSRRR